MSKCKKLLGLFLCMAMLFTSLPAVTVLADEAPDADGPGLPLNAAYEQLAEDSGTVQVDLSAEGDIDWVKMEGAVGIDGYEGWGLHRKTVDGAIVGAIEVSLLADTATSHMGDSRYAYSWGEGTFSGGVDSTSATVCNLGDGGYEGAIAEEVGYAIDIAADSTRDRVLQVYTSVWNATTNFSVYANGSNEASYSEDFRREWDSGYRRYSIEIPQGVSVRVVGSVLEATHSHGNIALGSITLADNGGDQGGEAIELEAGYWQLGDGETSAVNLTRLGDIDWVKMEGVVGESGHEGLGYHRKTRGGSIVDAIGISMLADTVTTRMNDSRFMYSWEEGTFSGGVNSLSATVYSLGQDNEIAGPVEGEIGYVIDIAADDTRDRELHIYTSVWEAAANLSVYANGSGSASYSEDFTRSGNAGYRRYTIEVPRGVSVTAVGRLLETTNSKGNLALGAVTLAKKAEPTEPVQTPVSVTIETAGGKMDLTGMGTLDWIHPTGKPEEIPTNRKQGGNGGVAGVIELEVLPDTRGANLNDAPVSYSWSDGTPDETATDDTTGAVYMGAYGTGAVTGQVGYSLTIPAGTGYRTLTFVSGVWQAVAGIDIYVNDEPESVYSNYDLTAGGSVVNKTYTVIVEPGASIEVVCRLESKSHGDGNVNLSAVTLGEIVIPPEPSEGYYKALLEELVALAREYDTPAPTGAFAFFVNQFIAKLADAEALLTEDSVSSDAYYMSYQFLLEALLGLHRMVGENQTYTFTSFPKVTGSFGWEGDLHAPIAFLDGSYRLRDRGNIMVTFGVGDIPGEIDWYNKEGYLPCYVHEYEKNGVQYTIETFADEVELNGERYVVAYSRVTTTNTTARRILLPLVSTSLVPLNEQTANTLFLPAGETIVRDYAIVADRFGYDVPIPADEELAAAGTWDEHYTHMRDYWNNRLEPLAEITKLPGDYAELINAYKAGYIYTLIIRDDIPQADGTVQRNLHVGENGYDEMFDHDTIGIVSTLLTMGDFTYAKEYLATLPAQLQYDDAKWKYSWPYALYLMKTDDFDFIAEKWSLIKTNTHNVETDRTAEGIIKQTFAIDSNGYWLIDNWAALAGLTTYSYLCERMYAQTGDAQYIVEQEWAEEQYYSLLQAVEAKQRSLREDNNYPYLSISMTEITEESARSSARDGNWASMFLFGRWGWDGYLFGADQEGSEMIALIDDTYTHGFNRREAIPDQGSMYNFGGYPHGFYSSAYNAGYGSTALRGEEYRDSGIKGYLFMVEEAMSSPFGWWEGVGLTEGETGGAGYAPKGPNSPWSTTHTAHGNGSNQHMWGQSTATKVLFDSLAAEKADGTLIVGRGIPEEWILDGEEVELLNYVVNGGDKVSYNLNSDGSEVTLTLTGNENVPVSLELIAFKNNIGGVTTKARAAIGIDQQNGIVTIPAGVGSVTVTLRNGQVSKTLLQDLYDEYSQLSKEDYTAESWNGFDAALTAGGEVLANPNASQEAIDNAYSALQAAHGKLVPQDNGPGTPDKSGLQGLYNKNKDLAQGSYTNESWKAFTDALATAKRVLDNPAATLEEIAAAQTALQAAVNGLKEGATNPTPTPNPTPEPTPKPAPNPDTGAGNGADSTIANTGDAAPVLLLVIVAGLAIIGLAALMILKKRREQ